MAKQFFPLAPILFVITNRQVCDIGEADKLVGFLYANEKNSTNVRIANGGIGMMFEYARNCILKQHSELCPVMSEITDFDIAIERLDRTRSRLFIEGWLRGQEIKFGSGLEIDNEYMYVP